MPDFLAAKTRFEAAQVADEPILTALFHDTVRPPVWAVFALSCRQGSRASYIHWQEELGLAVRSRFAPPNSGWRE